MVARWTSIIGFSGLGLSLSIGIAIVVGKVFGPVYDSEADMSRNVVVFLVAALLLAIGGGVLGNRIHSTRMTRDNSSRP